jgi:UDP-glucuronate 4-epimerase
MMRGFTFVDDIVEAVLKVLKRPPNTSDGDTPTKIYNVGNHQPVDLLEFIRLLENLLGKKAWMEFLPLEPGDVEKTYADMDDFSCTFNFEPRTSLQEGLDRFVAWYREYNGLPNPP